MSRGRYPPVNHRGPPPPAGLVYKQPPPPNIDPKLWESFKTADTDNSGEITAEELRQVLINQGNNSQFNGETCRLMIGMFDNNNSGGIDVHEFVALWKYVNDWRASFDSYDTDKSGNIDASELQEAFKSYGYNLSPVFVNLCITVFDRDNTASINFDDFIQCSIMVKSLTDQFRGKDVQQRGVLKLHYEEFLLMVLNSNNVI